MAGAVPAVELHVHLEGTLTPTLAARLAARNGATLPPFNWVRPGHRWDDPRRWLATMRAVGDACLRTPDDYAEAAADYIARLAADGVIYAELSLSLARTARGARDDMAILAAVCDAAGGGPIPVGVIAALDQQSAPEDALLQLRRAVSLRGRGLVGIDLHGMPAQRATVFAGCFALARAEGLGTRAHAGEMQGPRSVWDALELGVDRIAHGVRAIEDAALIDRLAADGVTLDLCPGGNVALGVVPDIASHPMRRLFDAGIRITLSSDDPLYFNTSARAEYDAASACFTADELLRITRMGIEASFAPPALRQALRAALTEEALVP